MLLRRVRNFLNARVASGAFTTTLMVLGIAWYLTEGGYEAAIAALVGIAGFVGTFKYSFLSFDKNLTADRLVLIVANTNYRNTPPLVNSTNDAEAICRSLADKGFRLIKRIDPTTAELRKAINDFQTILSTGGVGLFYYSGHAAQIDGRDYILPVDAELVQRSDFKTTAIDLNEVLAPIDQIIEDTPEHNGNIIIYSTSSGSVAFDWFQKPEEHTKDSETQNSEVKAVAHTPPPHSPFAGLFLEFLEKWNLEIFDLFRVLCKRLPEMTARVQVPWLAASVDTEFYFKPIVKEEVGILKILVFDACRNDPFYRPEVYYALDTRMVNREEMKYRGSPH